MKKLLSVGIVLAAALTAEAGQWFGQSFMAPDIISLCVSNKSQGVTNLSTSVAVATNSVGVTWTNSAITVVNSTNWYYTRVIVAGDGTAPDKHNPLNDVDLGSMDLKPIYYSDSANVNATNVYANCSIYIKMMGQSGANSAVTFVFYPVADDTGEVLANKITVTVTTTTTTPVTSLTPLPLTSIIGCKKLRCATISNADTDASSQVAILDFKLVGNQQ